MKKFLPIIIIIALVAVILCFAACGNNNVDDTITSMSNEMTSIMDDITSDMNGVTDGTTSGLFEDTTDLSDPTRISGTTDNSTTSESIAE